MPEQTASLGKVAEVLRCGGTAIFPTETVYGLGVSVLAVDGPEVLFDLKKRDHGKPVAWLVDSFESLDCYGVNLPHYAYSLARRFWPGPLTLIVQASQAVPEPFQSDTGTIGLRMPASDAALSLIQAVGCPLATTSANISGEQSVSSAVDVSSDLLAHVDIWLADSIDTDKLGKGSTVVDCTGERPVILRQGTISIEQVFDCL